MNHQKKELFFYEGALWFQKEFYSQKDDSKRYFIHFGAVENKANIFINGKRVGIHKGAYTPFNYEITDEIVNGNNFIIVNSNNEREAREVPPVNYDWWNFGGITRDVNIVSLPKGFIQSYYVQLAQGNLNLVKGWVQLSTAQKGQKVKVEIPELKWVVEGVSDEQGRVSIEKQIKKVSYWSPDNPKLYQVIVSSNQDEVKDEIGFRTIEVKGTEILLNKKPVFLKGICIHD